MAETENPQQASELQLVVFAVRGEEYALPIGSVHEVIRYSPPRSVSSSDPSLSGVINLRGSIVPVYDLRPVLGLGAVIERGGKIVIAALGETVAGIVVDEVAEVLTVETADLEDLPAVANETVRGVVRHGERLIVILDPARIVATTEGEPPPAPGPAG